MPEEALTPPRPEELLKPRQLKPEELLPPLQTRDSRKEVSPRQPKEVLLDGRPRTLLLLLWTPEAAFLAAALPSHVPDSAEVLHCAAPGPGTRTQAS